VEHYKQKVSRLSADRGLTPFGFELRIAVITCWEQVLKGDVTVVSYFIILVGKRFVAVLARGDRSVSSEVVGGHGRQRNLMGENFADGFAV